MTRKTYLATEHDIDTHLIDPDALFVIEKLREAGFEAYLVGGCVRDLLLGRKPKDWDITTNAQPLEIESLFPETFANNVYGTVGVVTESAVRSS